MSVLLLLLLTITAAAAAAGESSTTKMMRSSPLIIRGSATQSATVFILHGLGDSGMGWQPVAEMLRGELPHVKWILPHAPTRPVTRNGGYRMPAWFDVFQPATPPLEDRQGITDTVAEVNKMIEQEIAGGIPAERIVLGGFSQGGAIALYGGLTSKHNLGGILALSTYLPLQAEFYQQQQQQQQQSGSGKIPVLMCHGDADGVISLERAQQSAQVLRAHHIELSFITYPAMPHSTHPDEIADILAFLKKIIP